MQRDWFSKYSHEILRNTHLEYIQSDNDINGRNHINGRSLRSVLYREVYNNINFFVSYVRLSLSKHTCVFLLNLTLIGQAVSEEKIFEIVD